MRLKLCQKSIKIQKLIYKKYRECSAHKQIYNILKKKIDWAKIFSKSCKGTIGVNCRKELLYDVNIDVKLQRQNRYQRRGVVFRQNRAKLGF